MDNLFLLEDGTLAVVDYESKDSIKKRIKYVTQTSHIKNGIRTLKNQYFSPQNTLMRLFFSVPMHPACILGDAEQSWL